MQQQGQSATTPHKDGGTSSSAPAQPGLDISPLQNILSGLGTISTDATGTSSGLLPARYWNQPGSLARSLLEPAGSGGTASSGQDPFGRVRLCPINQQGHPAQSPPAVAAGGDTPGVPLQSQHVSRWKSFSDSIPVKIDYGRSPLARGPMGTVYIGRRYEDLVGISPNYHNPAWMAKINEGGGGDVDEARGVMWFETYVIKQREFGDHIGVPLKKANLERSTLLRLQQDAAEDDGSVVGRNNVVNLRWYAQAESSVFFVFEHCDGGDLSQHIRSGRLRGNETRVRRLFAHLILGLGFLEEKLVQHRNLKPANLLLSGDLDTGVLKISDFGISRIANSDKEYVTPTRTVGVTQEGTARYWSPERRDKQEYSAAAEYYAAGLILFEMLTGEGFQSFEDAAFRDPLLISPEAADLLKELLAYDATQRINCREAAFCHRWFDPIRGADIGWSVPEAAEPFLVDNIDIGTELLGEGAEGKVFKGVDRVSKKTVAVKCSTKGILPGRSLSEEYELLKRLRHKNIINVLGFKIDATNPRNPEQQVFMDFAPHGSLAHKVKLPLPEDDLRRYLRDMLEGLAYLHGQKVLHRDIKPCNMLIDADGSLKLSDFGISRVLANDNTNGVATTTTTVMGSTPYMAPEAFSGKYSTGSDLWGVGCSVVQIVTGKLPWSEMGFPAAADLEVHIKSSGTHPKIPSHLSEGLTMLLETMFAQNPEERGSAPQALSSEFFSEEVSVDTQSHTAGGGGGGDAGDGVLIWSRSDGGAPISQPGSSVQGLLTDMDRALALSVVDEESRGQCSAKGI